MEQVKKIFLVGNSDYFESILKCYDLSGFSLWNQTKSYKKYQTLACCMLAFFWFTKLWNLLVIFIDFDLHDFMKLLGTTFIHFGGLLKFFALVRSMIFVFKFVNTFLFTVEEPKEFRRCNVIRQDLPQLQNR
jgi:hypothetical protein